MSEVVPKDGHVVILQYDPGVAVLRCVPWGDDVIVLFFFSMVGLVVVCSVMAVLCCTLLPSSRCLVVGACESACKCAKRNEAHHKHTHTRTSSTKIAVSSPLCHQWYATLSVVVHCTRTARTHKHSTHRTRSVAISNSTSSTWHTAVTPTAPQRNVHSHPRSCIQYRTATHITHAPQVQFLISIVLTLFDYLRDFLRQRFVFGWHYWFCQIGNRKE